MSGPTQVAAEPLPTARFSLLADRRRLIVGIAVGLVLFVAAVILAIKATRQPHDFSVFWRTGRAFLQGRSLYETPPGAMEFIYPPFAAMVFQTLGWLPLRTGAAIFSLINLGLTISAVILARRVVQLAYPYRQLSGWAILAAVMMSVRFLAANLTLLNINMVVFVLCLLGIQAALLGRVRLAAAVLTMTTFLKIVPVVLLGWLVLRYGRRTILPLALVSLACLTLPLAQRGWQQGSRDLVEFHQTFLEQFTRGEVRPEVLNQSLPASLHRLLHPRSTPRHRWIPPKSELAAQLMRWSSLAVAASLIINLVVLRLRRRQVGVFELSAVFLATHLVSGITWKAHLVTWLLVGIAWLSLDSRRLSRAGRVALYAVWAALIAVNVLGQDLVGERIHEWADQVGLLTWMMVAMYVAALWLSQRSPPLAAAGPSDATDMDGLQATRSELACRPAV